MTEQSTTLEGEVSYLKNLSERVEVLGDQIVKWDFRLPDLTNDESDEKVPTAFEVREELTELSEDSYKKFRQILNRLYTLEEIVDTLELARDEIMGKLLAIR